MKESKAGKGGGGGREGLRGGGPLPFCRHGGSKDCIFSFIVFGVIRDTTVSVVYIM